MLCVLIHGCFQTCWDEAVVFNLHIAFLTVKGKQRGLVNVEDFDVVVDGFQQFVDDPLPESLVIATAEIDRLAVAAVGIYNARRNLASIAFEKPKSHAVVLLVKEMVQDVLRSDNVVINKRSQLRSLAVWIYQPKLSVFGSNVWTRVSKNAPISVSNLVVKRWNDYLAVTELHAHFAVLCGDDFRKVA